MQTNPQIIAYIQTFNTFIKANRKKYNTMPVIIPADIGAIINL